MYEQPLTLATSNPKLIKGVHTTTVWQLDPVCSSPQVHGVERRGGRSYQAMNEVDAGRDCAMLASSSSEEEEWREAAEGTNGNEERV